MSMLIRTEQQKLEYNLLTELKRHHAAGEHYFVIQNSKLLTNSACPAADSTA
jgi:hypothetical protein